MKWLGKLLGGILGFILGGNVIVTLIGVALGHVVDVMLKDVDLRRFRRRTKADTEKIQSAFFSATFSMMGHIAKADGSISRLEVVVAQDIMKEMRLNPKQKKIAIQLFEQGKREDFPVDDLLKKFKRECYHRNSLVQMFLEIQAVTALADGRLTEIQNRILRKCAKSLGYSTQDFQTLLRQMRTNNPYKQKKKTLLGHDSVKLDNAYKLLGVSEVDEDNVLKTAYRRQMNKHHPDKLVSKGATHEALNIANQKAQNIKDAYEFIRIIRKSEAL